MNQRELFTDLVPAMRVRFTTPVDLGTGDCGQIAQGEDGCDYVIKDASTHPLIPHAEWFCTELGERIGIAAPAHKVMIMLDGTMAFGSRWAGGTLSPDGAAPWYEKVASGEIDLVGVGRTLSRIYALDQFIHNRDRHAANVLVHPQFQGHAILAFDYSQAWIIFGFPLPPPPLPVCRTVEVQRRLSAIWAIQYIDADLVGETCEAIRKVSVASIVDIIRTHPQIWLDELRRDAIIDWWGSEDMNRRLDSIVKGVKNGDFL